MTVTEAVQKRRSIRGFKPDPIPEALLQEIVELACLAPSNCNTQPWHLTVVSGAMRDRLEQEFMHALETGVTPTPAFKPGDMNLEGVYRERQIDCAVRYYNTMGIERQDREKRLWLAQKNWQFFGAPHVAFLSMPTSMGEVNAIDVGIYLQTFMLLLVERGLASIPQGALAHYPEPVERLIGLPEGHGILCGISFGYEDPSARINEVKTDRAPVSNTVTRVQ